MALKKSEKRMLIILGIVALGFLIDRVFLTDGEKEKKVKDSPKKSAAQKINDMVLNKQVNNTDNIKKPVKILSSKMQFDNWGRDPFSKLQNRKKDKIIDTAKTKIVYPKRVLKGFFTRGNKLYVLIDKLVLAEGEEKEGLKVLKIENNVVYCRELNRTFTLYWSN